jgi:cellulose synthase/poly-beta-1,6-N-acetylglucosamine synthase-like glycosyltransferase
MSTPLLELIFWICVGAVVYHYAGYPLVLFLLAQVAQAKSDLSYLLRRRHRRQSCANDFVPRVALLVAAYNEEAVIQAKVENTLQIDYPADCLDLLFGLDSPTDATPAILAQLPTACIQIHQFENRRGKLAVLCDLARRTSAEILVFTDANTMLDRNCVRNLVRHFADPRVGAASGEEVRVAGAGANAGGESLYWRYESALKFLENRLNCSLGGNGAALAVRYSLFHPVKQSIVEDFQIPLEIRFKGHRVVYDPEAIAVEEIAPTFAAQFSRRVRIGAGNYQTLFTHLDYLNPFRGLLAFSFLSHRVLRWCVPVLLLLALVCSFALVNHPKFAVITAAQCTFYVMAALGYWLRKTRRRSWLLAGPLYFCAMNLALLLGLFRYLAGSQTLAWNPTPRIGAEILVKSTRSDR